MNHYSLRCGHGHGRYGQIIIEAASCRAAIRTARKLVADGYRGETWAAVDLPGMTYVARNSHGRVVGRLHHH